jgi:hypothetical protein
MCSAFSPLPLKSSLCQVIVILNKFLHIYYNEINLMGDNFRKWPKTFETSQVLQYLGSEGLKLYTPFINLIIIILDPTGTWLKCIP